MVEYGIYSHVLIINIYSIIFDNIWNKMNNKYSILDIMSKKLFVSDRIGQVLDIFIDTTGSLTSILLIRFIKRKE